MSVLLFNSHPVVVSRELAEMLGINESIFLQQLHYWLQRSNHFIDGRKWVYNTYKDWQEQFSWCSTTTIKRVITSLEKQGFIITGNYNSLKIDKTKWYSIDYEKVYGLSMGSKWPIEEVKMTSPLPEITTEITTDIKRSSKIFADDSIELILARELKEYILVNNSKSKVPSNLNSWANDFDKMIRIDKREVSDIRNVMRFCQNDNFWKPNILSAKKLRQKFDTLYLQMGNGLTLNNADKIKKLEDM